MSSGRGGGLAVPGTSTSGASGAAVRRPARQTVDFSLKGPVHVTLDETPAGPPGCSVVDLLFAAPSQVSELVFHNYYTAWLTVLVRMLVAAPGPGPGPAPELGTPGQPQQTEQGQLQSGDAVPAVPAAQVQQQVQGDASSKLRKESGWVVAVARRVLMPSPHLETGSHDFVSILATEVGASQSLFCPTKATYHGTLGEVKASNSVLQSTVPWTELVAMRLVLRQPSPSWHTFHVEEIHVFAEPPRRAVWGRRHGPPAAAAVSSGSPAVGAGAAVGGAADQSAYDSVLMLLRQQTQAALRSNAGPVGSSMAAGTRTPTTPTRVPAYELNSLPPV
ncbi:uncharacterized protein LOC113213100 isoform X3 [Frankliniella occidentalis]|uniref:Uncharacterized protein LOC113213100 isoform X3 n=1 Tax=Frankliniella occidentalis TaxID=133901 RepID=A0A6J1T2Q5_FRAOC|nr:uncharacterized protein LOC113213100 isoform X3 [Frankliniella occidentalis]